MAAGGLWMALWNPVLAGVLQIPDQELTAQAESFGRNGAHLKGFQALGVNPAGLGFVEGEVFSQYRRLPDDSTLMAFGGSAPLPGVKGVLAVSYLQVKSPTFDGRDQNGNPTGGFNTRQEMTGVHVSLPLGPQWSAGVGVKRLASHIPMVEGRGWAGEAGVRWESRPYPLALGLAALNMGPAFREGGAALDLPSRFILSGTWRVSGPMVLGGGVSQELARRRVSFFGGVEYAALDWVVLRGAYQEDPVFGQGIEESFLDALALGVGVLVGEKRLSMDISLRPFSSKDSGSDQRKNDPHFTLVYRFGH
jgi:hypothetical protein